MVRPHRQAWLLLLGGVLAGASLGRVRAAAPPAATDPEDAPPSRGGYFLSTELAGKAASRAAAARALAAGLDPRAPRDRLPPGEGLGFFPRIEHTLLWIEQHAFDGQSTRAASPMLELAPAPRIASALQADFGVFVRAFVVTGATAEGDTRSIDWPADGSSILATDSDWRGAALIPDSAPLFAAPAPTTPPAAEGFARAQRSGEIYVAGTHDRCTSRAPAQPPQCLRWLRVVARDGDRFVPGYLPAYQVAVRDDWVRGQGALPRAQLIRTGMTGGDALFVLLARARDNVLHRTTLRVPATGRFPELTLTVEGDWGIIRDARGTEQRFALDATLDARP